MTDGSIWLKNSVFLELYRTQNWRASYSLFFANLLKYVTGKIVTITASWGGLVYKPVRSLWWPANWYETPSQYYKWVQKKPHLMETNNLYFSTGIVIDTNRIVYSNSVAYNDMAG